MLLWVGKGPFSLGGSKELRCCVAMTHTTHTCYALSKCLQLLPPRAQTQSSFDPGGIAVFVTASEKSSNNYLRWKLKKSMDASVHIWVGVSIVIVKNRLNSLFSEFYRPLVTDQHLLARRINLENIKTAKSSVCITNSCQYMKQLVSRPGYKA